MGIQLTALRECTRDVEWKLMKITIIDFDSKAEFQFAAERTAADAARIQAPLQFHGDEPELAEALSGLAPSDIQLHFECHTIMVGMLTMYTLIILASRSTANPTVYGCSLLHTLICVQLQKKLWCLHACRMAMLQMHVSEPSIHNCCAKEQL